MRTTLDLDEDVLLAAKEIARTRGVSAGRVVSDLVRKALTPDTGDKPRIRNGVPVFARRPGAAPLTMARVNRMRDA